MPLPLAESCGVPLDALYRAALEKAHSDSVLDLPFSALGVTLTKDSTAEEIHEMYGSLMRGAEKWMSTTEASYNVLWTTEWFVLIPRSKEKHGLCSLK